jgi:hypothetical protein
MAIKALAAVLLLALGLAGCATQPSEMDLYTQKCHDKGGVVSMVEQTWTTAVSKCTGETGELLARYGGQ